MTTVASTNVITGNRKNYIINSDFKINQRTFAGGALADTDYGYDRWKAGGASDMSATDGVLTIVSGTAIQIVEDFGYTGPVTISWEGTSTVNGVNTSPYTYTKIAGNDTLTFEPGTLSKVKMEIGSSQTDYDYPDPASELVKCQRYFQRITFETNSAAGAGYILTSTRSFFSIPLARKRVVPTITASAGAVFIVAHSAGGIAGTFAAFNAALEHTRIEMTGAGYSPGDGATLNADPASIIDADAEL